MGAGISVRNESDVPLLVVCSQLTPLHWGKCLPGETWNAKNEQKMGKVWFTVSVGVYDHTQEPDGAKVALRIATITAATVLSGGLVGVGVVGTASALTSTMGVKKDGVYADCRCLVVRGVRHGDGCYQLFFAIEEKLDEKTGAVKSSKVLAGAPEARAAAPLPEATPSPAAGSSLPDAVSFFEKDQASEGTGADK